MIDVDLLLAKLNFETLRSILRNIVTQGYWHGMKAGQKETLGKFIEPQDQFTIDALENRIMLLSQGTKDRIIGNLKEHLIEGISLRESIPSLMERVRDDFAGMKEWETERLVRTEVMTAVNTGRNDAWITSNVANYKMWWNAAIGNKRTADDSKRMYGQIVKVDEPFIDPETGTHYMMPPMRPNDRCTARPLKVLPENIILITGQMYDGTKAQKEAKIFKSPIIDVLKGGVGSGIKGHRTDTSQLPLSMGAFWEDLKDADYRDMLRRRASRGKEVEIVHHLDDLYKFATREEYKTKENKKVFFGLRGEKFSNMKVGETFEARGARSATPDFERAKRYGEVFELDVPKGSVLVDATVMGIDENVLLPGSKFEVSGKSGNVTKIKLLSDGSEYVKELKSFQDELNNLTKMREGFNVEKGGVGSGIKGHTTAQSKVLSLTERLRAYTTSVEGRQANITDSRSPEVYGLDDIQIKFLSEVTLKQFINNIPSGFVFGGDSGTEEAQLLANGKIQLNNKFFAHNTNTRAHILRHEEGHRWEKRIITPDNYWEIYDSNVFKDVAGIGMNGAFANLHEFVAEAKAVYDWNKVKMSKKHPAPYNFISAIESGKNWKEALSIAEKFPFTTEKQYTWQMTFNEALKKFPSYTYSDHKADIASALKKGLPVSKDIKNLYEKYSSSIVKGGVGSGIKGHRTAYHEKLKKMSEGQLVKEFKDVLDMKRQDIKDRYTFDNYDMVAIWYSGTSMDIMDKIATESVGLNSEMSRPLKKEHEDVGVTENNKVGVKKIYSITQEMLRRKYPDGKVTLYRGLDKGAREALEVRMADGKADIDVYSLSSWSTDKTKADFFAKEFSVGGGAVVSKSFDIKNILLSPEVSIGHDYVKNRFWEQQEHIVMSKSGKINVGVELV